MSQLLDNLKRFDPGVAALYLEATGDRPGVKINKAAAEKIFNYALKDNRIQINEARAFMQLLLLGKFTPDAKDFLIGSLYQKVMVDEVLESNRPSKALRDEIAHALSGVVTSQIQFMSPYTHITYYPAQYAAVSKLIDSGDIVVWALDSGASGLFGYLGGGTATYRSDLDRLIVPNWDFGFAAFYPLVVHEATHAIQDWLDKDDLFSWQVETDAYVAQAVAEHTIKLKSSEKVGDLARVASDRIGKLLKVGKGLFGNPFQAACKEVFNAVKVAPLYRDNKDTRFAEVAKDKKRSVP
jgi:hypothetical protein